MCNAGFYPTPPVNVVSNKAQAIFDSDDVGREAPNNNLQNDQWISVEDLFCDIYYYYYEPPLSTVDICGTQSDPFYDATCVPQSCPAPQSTGGHSHVTYCFFSFSQCSNQI